MKQIAYPKAPPQLTRSDMCNVPIIKLNRSYSPQSKPINSDNQYIQPKK